MPVDQSITSTTASASIVDSGALEWIIDDRVETKLYYLSVRGRVEYQPGQGWKLDEQQDSPE